MMYGPILSIIYVALRKESVDRNSAAVLPPRLPPVALRKESVDRNFLFIELFLQIFQSLSARRAWIEITPRASKSLSRESLSARRAWIEIAAYTPRCHRRSGRSPQGERG